MDRIGKALIKAQQDNKTRQGPSRGTRRLSRSLQKSLEPIDITYEQTRTKRVPPRVLAEHRVIAGQRGHPQADVYRILRTQVLRRLGELGGNTVGICSPNASDGKSLTAANLAVSLSMVPTQTVLLVDLDLRRPDIHRHFGLSLENGLSDYLLGKRELSDCLVHPGIDRLVVLPAGKSLHYSSELLSSPKMEALVKDLKGRYPDRLIVYDLPPLLSSDDALVFVPYIDGSILVIREGKTRKREILRSLDILQNFNFLGTILNNSAEKYMDLYY